MKKSILALGLSIAGGLLFGIPVAFAAPAFVQSTSTAAGTIAVNATSASEAFVSNVTAGDLILAFVRWQANGTTQTSSITSVTDNHGDTFLPAFNAQYDASATPTVGSQLWYALNAAGGATTSTANFSTSTNGNGVRMAVLEYSGIATSSALDVATTSIQLVGSTTFYSGFITTNFKNEVLVGGFSAAASSHNCTAGTGFTKREPNAAFTVPYCVEDQVVSATGTYQATGTYSAAADFAPFIVGFSASSSQSATFSVTATSSFISASTTTIPLVFSTAAHDLLVVAEFDSSATTTAPTDSGGNTYLMVTSTTNGGTGYGAMYYVANANATVTSTCNFFVSTNVSCTMFDIAGAATSSPLDATSAIGTSTSVTNLTSSPLTTSNANDILLFAARAGNNQTSFTAGNGYTFPANTTNTRSGMQYQITTAATTATTTSMSWTVAGNGMGIFAAFKNPQTFVPVGASPKSRGEIITFDW